MPDYTFMQKVIDIGNSVDGIKLNVGCGDIILDGYVNIDINNPKADINADARDLPYDDDGVGLVECHHMIEHLNKLEAEDVLREFLRIIKPGGWVLLSCPDMVTTCNAIMHRGDQVNSVLWDGYMSVVYGQTTSEFDKHRWGYNKVYLKKLLGRIGFGNIRVEVVVGLRPTPTLFAVMQKEN